MIICQKQKYVKKLLICSNILRFFVGIKIKTLSFSEHYDTIIYVIRLIHLEKKIILYIDITNNSMGPKQHHIQRPPKLQNITHNNQLTHGTTNTNNTQTLVLPSQHQRHYLVLVHYSLYSPMLF